MQSFVQDTSPKWLKYIPSLWWDSTMGFIYCISDVTFWKSKALLLYNYIHARKEFEMGKSLIERV